jgi:hypothetical protein
LGAIGVPGSKRGIKYAQGVDGFPAFEIQDSAHIKEPAQAFFKNPIYRDFAIGITVKPSKKSGGFLFAVKNLYNTIVQFGVELTGNQLILYYTSNVRYASTSKKLVSFDIGDIHNKWTKLSLKVQGDEVTLYKNCAKLETIKVAGKNGPLDVEGGANLYVAQGGDNFNNKFTVSLVMYSSCSIKQIYV